MIVLLVTILVIVGLIPTITSVALGARIIERHITLDRSMWGSDQSASIEPNGLIKLFKQRK